MSRSRARPPSVFSFRGVFDQVQEDLNKLILIGENRRQGRIVIFDKFGFSREAGLGEPFDMIEHRVNVDGTARHRAFVAKYFHAVDQRNDGSASSQIGRVSIRSSDEAPCSRSWADRECRTADF